MEMDRIAASLELWLEKHDRIWLWPLETEEDRELLLRFLVSDAARKNEKSILVLSKGAEHIYGTDRILIKQLPPEDYIYLEKLYYMYECSNRMQRIPGSVQYGSLQNFITTGVLTEEEMFLAWLH